MSTEQEHNATRIEATDSLDVSRRTFLKNAGKVVAYMPPAMLAMSSPSFRAIAQSSGGGDQAPSGGGGSWLEQLLRWLFGR
jgi:hypothetical protein